MNRAGKAIFEVMPAHRFAERDRHDIGRQSFLKELGCFFANLLFFDANILSFFGADYFKFLRFYALTPGKADSGFTWCSRVIESYASSRPHVFNDSVFLS